MQRPKTPYHRRLSGRNPSTSSYNSDDKSYKCYVCSYSTDRVNLIICHLKTHSDDEKQDNFYVNNSSDYRKRTSRKSPLSTQGDIRFSTATTQLSSPSSSVSPKSPRKKSIQNKTYRARKFNFDSDKNVTKSSTPVRTYMPSQTNVTRASRPTTTTKTVTSVPATSVAGAGTGTAVTAQTSIATTSATITKKKLIVKKDKIISSLTNEPKTKAEIRKAILADWSEDDTEDNVSEKSPKSKSKETTPNKQEPADIQDENCIQEITNIQPEKDIDEMIKTADSTTTSSDDGKQSIENNSINKINSTPKYRNIPKKDRRDVVLKEFSNGDILNARNNNTTSKSDDSQILNVTNNSDMNALNELPNNQMNIDKEEDDMNLNKQDNEENIDNNNKNNKKQLTSCFDFPEEEEDDEDFLTSLSKLKKKYMSPEKPKESCDGEINTTTTSNTISEDNEAESMSVKLKADVENLLNSTKPPEIKSIPTQEKISSPTIPDTVTKDVRALPPKERGKRIFKSRNKSNLDDTLCTAESRSQESQPEGQINDSNEEQNNTLGEALLTIQVIPHNDDTDGDHVVSSATREASGSEEDLYKFFDNSEELPSISPENRMQVSDESDSVIELGSTTSSENYDTENDDDNIDYWSCGKDNTKNSGDNKKISEKKYNNSLEMKENEQKKNELDIAKTLISIPKKLTKLSRKEQIHSDQIDVNTEDIILTINSQGVIDTKQDNQKDPLSIEEDDENKNDDNKSETIYTIHPSEDKIHYVNSASSQISESEGSLNYVTAPHITGDYCGDENQITQNPCNKTNDKNINNEVIVIDNSLESKDDDNPELVDTVSSSTEISVSRTIKRTHDSKIKCTGEKLQNQSSITVSDETVIDSSPIKLKSNTIQDESNKEFDKISNDNIEPKPSTSQIDKEYVKTVSSNSSELKSLTSQNKYKKRSSPSSCSSSSKTKSSSSDISDKESLKSTTSQSTSTTSTDTSTATTATLYSPHGSPRESSDKISKNQIKSKQLLGDDSKISTSTSSTSSPSKSDKDSVVYSSIGSESEKQTSPSLSSLPSCNPSPLSGGSKSSASRIKYNKNVDESSPKKQKHHVIGKKSLASMKSTIFPEKWISSPGESSPSSCSTSITDLTKIEQNKIVIVPEEYESSPGESPRCSRTINFTKIANERKLAVTSRRLSFPEKWQGFHESCGDQAEDEDPLEDRSDENKIVEKDTNLKETTRSDENIQEDNIVEAVDSRETDDNEFDTSHNEQQMEIVDENTDEGIEVDDILDRDDEMRNDEYDDNIEIGESSNIQYDHNQQQQQQQQQVDEIIESNIHGTEVLIKTSETEVTSQEISLPHTDNEIIVNEINTNETEDIIMSNSPDEIYDDNIEVDYGEQSLTINYDPICEDQPQSEKIQSNQIMILDHSTIPSTNVENVEEIRQDMFECVDDTIIEENPLTKVSTSNVKNNDTRIPKKRKQNQEQETTTTVTKAENFVPPGKVIRIDKSLLRSLNDQDKYRTVKTKIMNEGRIIDISNIKTLRPNEPGTSNQQQMYLKQTSQTAESQEILKAIIANGLSNSVISSTPSNTTKRNTTSILEDGKKIGVDGKGNKFVIIKSGNSSKMIIQPDVPKTVQQGQQQFIADSTENPTKGKAFSERKGTQVLPRPGISSSASSTSTITSLQSQKPIKETAAAAAATGIGATSSSSSSSSTSSEEVTMERSVVYPSGQKITAGAGSQLVITSKGTIIAQAIGQSVNSTPPISSGTSAYSKTIKSYKQNPGSSSSTTTISKPNCPNAFVIKSGCIKTPPYVPPKNIEIESLIDVSLQEINEKGSSSNTNTNANNNNNNNNNSSSSSNSSSSISNTNSSNDDNNSSNFNKTNNSNSCVQTNTNLDKNTNNNNNSNNHHTKNEGNTNNNYNKNKNSELIDNNELPSTSSLAGYRRDDTKMPPPPSSPSSSSSSSLSSLVTTNTRHNEEDILAKFGFKPIPQTKKIIRKSKYDDISKTKSSNIIKQMDIPPLTPITSTAVQLKSTKKKLQQHHYHSKEKVRDITASIIGGTTIEGGGASVDGGTGGIRIETTEIIEPGEGTSSSLSPIVSETGTGTGIGTITATPIPSGVMINDGTLVTGIGIGNISDYTAIKVGDNNFFAVSGESLGGPPNSFYLCILADCEGGLIPIDNRPLFLDDTNRLVPALPTETETETETETTEIICDETIEPTQNDVHDIHEEDEQNLQQIVQIQLPSSDREQTNHLIQQGSSTSPAFVIDTTDGHQILLDQKSLLALMENGNEESTIVLPSGEHVFIPREILSSVALAQTNEIDGGQLLLKETSCNNQTDIIAEALANTDVYQPDESSLIGDVLQIDSANNVQIVDQQNLAAFQGINLTSQTNETNAILTQPPIMSTLEVPSNNKKPHHYLHNQHENITTINATNDNCLLGQNLDDSLAVIGVTTQQSTVPSSLELPITVTNPAIAPKTISNPIQLGGIYTTTGLSQQTTTNQISPSLTSIPSVCIGVGGNDGSIIGSMVIATATATVTTSDNDNDNNIHINRSCGNSDGGNNNDDNIIVGYDTFSSSSNINPCNSDVESDGFGSISKSINNSCPKKSISSISRSSRLSNSTLTGGLIEVDSPNTVNEVEVQCHTSESTNYDDPAR